MGSFKRVLLGYRRAEVDAAIELFNEQIAEQEKEFSCLTAMVIEREREIRELREELLAVNERHDRSIASLESVSQRLEELHAQARGQATRIRMKALREAVEVSRRVQELAGRIGSEPAEAAEIAEVVDAATASANGHAEPDDNGHAEAGGEELFEGDVQVEIGPLGDFSQLVGFEDAAGQIGAGIEISVERFSEGRATLSMRLGEPVPLLRELEQRSPLDFRVRQNGEGRLVLDVDADDAPQQRAA